ncbi:hypothetical protein MLD52_14945 [Puniceicoccaceae bacterium K14]|nr:hypothetical protein [Puniceicoccaceae bacterium K14]
MSLKYFGTDGIRGEYGGSLLTDELAFRVGVAAAEFAKSAYSTAEPTLLIGRDTRQSGVRLEKCLASGFASRGGRIHLMGVAPTPAIAFACSSSDADVACAITASHNPHTDNGLKFFQSNGTKLDESMEQSLDDAVGEALPESLKLIDYLAEDVSALLGKYTEALLDRFGRGLLDNRKVALDCANGATSFIATQLFEGLGATVTATGVSPDGENINKKVGSEYPESLQTLLDTSGFDYGFAFDGDGDRVVVFDDKGEKLSGESVMAALAIGFKESKRLSGDVLVTTAQSNLGLDFALKSSEIAVERVGIGDKFVSRKMLAKNYSLGGEESGHFIIGEFSMTGDGMCSALAVAQMVENSKKPLAELTSVYKAFPQASQSVRVVEKIPLERCEALQKCISTAEASLGEEGRLLIRYSGTEPKLRLLVEASDQTVVDDTMNHFLEAVAKDLTLA